MRFIRVFIVILFFSITDLSMVNAKRRKNRRIETRNSTLSLTTQPNGLTSNRENKILCEYYTQWTGWSRCNRKCEQTRVRRCNQPENCGSSVLKEKQSCRRKKGRCSTLSYKVIGFRRGNRLIEELLYDLLYDGWSQWGHCTRACRKRRFRKCKEHKICGNSYIQEERKCRSPGNICGKKYFFNTFEPDRHSPSVTALSPRERAREQKAPLLVSTQGQCGVRPRGGYRIVGGKESIPHSWPWQVAILTKWKEQYCGGTLIAPGWVLTAAHCIRRKGHKRKVIVRVGEHEIHVDNKNEVDMKVEQDFPHKSFDYETITNDIALLKLRKPERIKDLVEYACLPEPEDKLADGTSCYIVGWGKQKNTHLLGSESLREAEVPIVSKKKCRKAFDYRIGEKQICAGLKKGGVDSCAGDSGGPLICPKIVNGTERWVVYGVTSYGEGCGQKGKYGIYTKVSHYLKWINRVIRNNS